MRRSRCDNHIDDAETAEKIESALVANAHALGAYGRSSEVSRFASRYDRWVAGQGTLSAQEEADRVAFLNTLTDQ